MANSYFQKIYILLACSYWKKISLKLQFFDKIFDRFVNLFNISLDEYRLFLSHTKYVSLMMIASE